MKESHFELPRSQYMESQSQRSRISFGSKIGGCDTNAEQNGEGQQ